MKKLFALLLAVLMMAALAVPAHAAEGTVTVYLDIGDTVLRALYCYAFETENPSNFNASWPGVPMTQVEGSIYSVELDPSQNALIFNDGSSFQVETELPTNGRNLYTCSNEEWSTYEGDGTDISEGDSSGKGEGSYNIDVNGSYTAGAGVAKVISVDIAWDAMSFTYTDSSLGTWDPKTHSYINGTEGGWSDNKSSITVTNHSNDAITATFGFTAADGVTTTGSFYASADATTALTAEKQQLSLATAVGTERVAAPAGTIYFGISGDAISANTALGTITVKIEKDKWTRVSNIAELSEALYNGGYVMLTNDITDGGWVDVNENTVLDLNGKTLNANLGTAAGWAIDYVVKNGTLNSTQPQYVSSNHTLTVSDCTINAGSDELGSFALAESGATLILSGTVNVSHKIVCTPGNTVYCRAGTYNFDPTVYVDTNGFDVVNNGDGTWTVSETIVN